MTMMFHEITRITIVQFEITEITINLPNLPSFVNRITFLQSILIAFQSINVKLTLHMSSLSTSPPYIAHTSEYAASLLVSLLASSFWLDVSQLRCVY